IETPTQIAGQVAQALLLGQGKDHVSTWRERLAAVTATDVQRVAQKYLRADNALIVISGDAQLLKPKLERFGKITVVDEEGRQVAAAAPAPAGQSAGLDASGITPMTLVYGVTVAGMGEMMEMTRTITRETKSGKDVVHAKEVSTGRQSGTSDLMFEAKTFKPVSMNAQMSAGGRDFSSVLTVADGKISGMVPTPPQGDPAMVDATLPDGAILQSMVDYAIWVSPLTVGKEVSVTMFNPQTGTTMPLTA